MSICNSRGLTGLMFNLFLHNLSVPTLKTVFLFLSLKVLIFLSEMDIITEKKYMITLLLMEVQYD